ncbi:cysteine--tRNA ligase [Patescibacteria group bacterium]|nr:cysteine--tRNA ligase [Patescibacteria group bacterium]MBU0999699.1 cysteine--tRNA ligase [Patescibacteria group bacterium]
MLKFYNTLTRKKEIFRPIEKNIVRIYTCGPTVYNYAHIGNLSAYLFSDLLKRYLRYSGFRLIDVMNLTDVDDKTIKASQENDQPLRQYTSFFIDALLEDFEKLNIIKPKVLCRATDHINEMIDLIKKLVNSGHAYRAEDGSVYYKISTFKDYGKFARLKKDQLKNNASGRISNDEYKKEEATDFVLWKKWNNKDGEVCWNSPFGKGRPGWHIECSAMSMKYLGETLDIHTGAVDLIFPHHQNEIAQSESVTGKQFVCFWLHRGFLKINNEKMSKSLGNIYTLKDVLKNVPSPLAFRYLILTSNYRLGLNFTFKSLETASNTLSRLQHFIRKLSEINNNIIESEKDINKIKVFVQNSKNNFKNAMDDNLNASKAIADLFDFIRKINSLIDKNKIGVNAAKIVLNFLQEVNQVWGFLKFNEKGIDDGLKKTIEYLIEKRNEYRFKNDWVNADKIRDKLIKMNVVIRDDKNSTKWELKR